MCCYICCPLSRDTIFRDIEKFLKGYGYIRNISVKVAPPTSLEYFWHHSGWFILAPPQVSKLWHLQTQVSKLWHLHKCQFAGTYSPSTFRKDTGSLSLKIVATLMMLSRCFYQNCKNSWKRENPKITMIHKRMKYEDTRMGYLQRKIK